MTGLLSPRGSPRQGGRPWQQAARDSALLLTLAAAAWGVAHLHGLGSTPACLHAGSSGSEDTPDLTADTGSRLALEPGHHAVRARGRTLVVYAYGGSDPEYPTNLGFFLDEAVKADDGCDYLIVMQQGEGVAPPGPLPTLPRNARFVRHPNKCFDWGTWGWALDSQVANLGSYEYFIFLNPSVRGPFLPAYLRGRMHWTEPLLSKLGDSVKLPHVQSYAVATDRRGLAVLRSAGSVFACHESMRDVIHSSELGSSRVILEAGFNIACLMQRYQARDLIATEGRLPSGSAAHKGVDWRRRETYAQGLCNGAANPLPAGANNGVDVDPLEVLFIKVKSNMLAAEWPAVRLAEKLSEWARLADEQAARAAAGLAPTDAWLESFSASSPEAPPASTLHRLADIRLQAAQRGQSCFDAAFYLASSSDLPGAARWQPDAAAWAWDHFLRFGAGEGRPFRFTC
ncbi:hypothetical protein ABPG77_011290 [Micractinium sp. CCAP 211/92]